MREIVERKVLEAAIDATGMLLGKPFVLLSRLQKILLFTRFARFQFRVRPDDVFLATYPKAGTTWLQMIAYQLMTDGDMSFQHLSTVSPFYEEIGVFGDPRILEALPSPRLLKTHLRHDQLPAGARYVYVVRNVRDTLVSYYRHAQLVDGYSGDLGAFSRAFLKGRMTFGDWFLHVESWWKRRRDPSVLILSYEQMRADLPNEVKKLASFLGVELTAERLERVLARSSLSFMKANDHKFDPRTSHVSAGSSSTFIREGRVGYSEVLDDSVQIELDERLDRLLDDLGCRGAERELPCWKKGS